MDHITEKSIIVGDHGNTSLLEGFWVGTSWKMNKALPEALSFARMLAAATPWTTSARCFVVPPFTVARDVKVVLRDTPILVGAQNMHWEDRGAWTGEISAPMLTDCGLDLVELGHSERRAHFGETDETVGLKVAQAMRHGLIPLVCIGETMEEKRAGQADVVLERQVRGALAAMSPEDRSPILFAYEPVWAIGEHGIPASPDHAERRQRRIIDIASSIMGFRVPCLYGGSVDMENCAAFAACPSVDGLFVGRAAWEASGYLDIVGRAATARAALSKVAAS